MAFRSAVIGQLVLLVGVCFSRQSASEGNLFKLFAIVCSIAYLLLTAPIPDATYGAFRNLLLILTDAWAYALWLAAMYQFQAQFSVRHMPFWAIPVVAIWLAWHLYFFGFMEGSGTYHDINHGLTILVLLHLMYVVLKGFSDDLVDSRRRLRFIVIGALAVYGATLAIDQLWLGRLLQANALSLANSVIVFVGVTLFSLYLLKADNLLWPSTASARNDKTSLTNRPDEDHPLKDALDAFIVRGDYTQPDLDIASMAAQLGGKEHQLRRLINQQLGFQNFSVFLNHLRIQKACEWLTSTEHVTTPIMNIALDLGYGSIGPFNRAFKQSTGVTPTQYRANFQNRR